MCHRGRQTDTQPREHPPVSPVRPAVQRTPGTTTNADGRPAAWLLRTLQSLGMCAKESNFRHTSAKHVPGPSGPGRPRPLPGPVRPHARRRPHGTPSRFSDGPGSLLSQARCTCCSCCSNRSMSRAPHPLTRPLPPSCRLPAQRSSVSEYDGFRSWL